jgi:hypothetical protein
MLLVSEDIPGITMPSAPVDLPPLEEEEPDFDLNIFRQEEDIEEEERGHEGPLRVFLGSDDDVTPVVATEDQTPVFDVSALAMPAGPSDDVGDERALEFLSDDEAFDDADVVDLDGGAPPPSLSMGVSSAVRVDDASAWEDTPTHPGQVSTPSTAVIRDTPPIPPVASALPGDPIDLPDPFEVDATGSTPAVVEVATAEPPSAPDALWDDDDMGFFDGETSSPPVGLPAEPPNLKVDSMGESRTFRAIPDKEDPPILPLLLLLIGIVIVSVFLWISYAGDQVTQPSAIPPVNPANVAPAIQPAPRTEGPGQVSEVAKDIGFITVHADKPATVYVDDKKVGTTPVIKEEVLPGSHRVLAVEVETGKRKAVTADVERGAERRVRFAFQPVQ